MDVGVFERQIQYIRRHFIPTRLDDLIERLASSRPIDSRSVVITIDDGYDDFFEYAYPVLRRYEVPATLYVVSTFASQTEWLWFDAIHWLCHHAARGNYAIDFGDARRTFELDGDKSRNALWESVADRCLRQDKEELKATIRGLAADLQLNLPAAPAKDYRALTWEELRSLDRNLIEIGAHSSTHQILSTCDREEQRREIEGCKQTIQNELGRTVNSFCYPNGLPRDVDETSVATVRACGYSNAVMAGGGMVTASSDRFRLQRLPAPPDIDEFMSCIDGLRTLR